MDFLRQGQFALFVPVELHKKSKHMTSSPTSSSTSTMSSSTSQSSSTNSLSKYNFDPFAVHPFTNCVSSNPNSTNTTTMNHNRSNPLYAYPYRQTLGDNHTPHTPIPSPLATAPSHQQSLESSSPNPYAYMLAPRPTGIFVPFRQETSSPELSDVLKSKSTSTSKTSKTRPNNTAAFIPATPPTTFSGSRKH